MCEGFWNLELNGSLTLVLSKARVAPWAYPSSHSSRGRLGVLIHAGATWACMCAHRGHLGMCAADFALMCGFDRLRLRTPCELFHLLGREVLGLTGTHAVMKVS